MLVLHGALHHGMQPTRLRILRVFFRLVLLQHVLGFVMRFRRSDQLRKRNLRMWFDRVRLRRVRNQRINRMRWLRMSDLCVCNRLLLL